MNAITSVLQVPDPGQLVQVRSRRFVVMDVKKSGLAPDPLRSLAGPQHFVTLSSVEDDAIGEELQVVWEIEPGARVFERMQFPSPDGFDDPRRLNAFLDAVRWGAVASADIKALQAPFRSGAEIEEYQLDPVVRALEMPRVNLLIADDVGLGKTIEAGLVVQELILRHRARRILIATPASLLIKWRDEMHDKFGLEFRIVDSDLMRDLRRKRGIYVNPWQHFPRLITSIDFLKRERPLRLFRETLPVEGEPTYPRRFDLLIVDEAHNVAPVAGSRYATESLKTLAIRELAPHFEHRLFLTATPHNGYPESFSALLELLDDQRFARGVEPDRRQLEAVMVRRLKDDEGIELRWDGTRRFAKRELAPLEVAYPEDEHLAHRALREYTTLRTRNAADGAERFAVEFVLKLLKKRLFSSPAAFATTLAKHVKSLAAAKGSGSSPAESLTLRSLRRQAEDLEEEFSNDDAYEESSADLVETASRLLRAPTPREAELLQELRAYATRATARPDAKAHRLIAWLKETVKPGGKWNRERVILFTEYRATQNWLYEKLAGEGFAEGERLLMLYGGMNTDDRERIKAAFQASPDDANVRILLATDAASEGIDLQNHCHRLIHYEIPWNPNRLEQRNGRIDRRGQKAGAVLVYHFVGEGYQRRAADPFAAPGDLEGDLEFLMRAAVKVEQIRKDLGKVGPVIASQVEEAMLGKRKQLDTQEAERAAEPARRALTFQRKVADQVRRLKLQLCESRQELRLAPENIQAVVEIGLDLADKPVLREAKVDGIWPDPTGVRTRCPVFHLPPLDGSWAPCAEGLRHPHTGVVRPIVFDADLAAGRDDVVLAHLNHRLVAMCLRLLREEVWSQAGRKRLHRVTARLVPNLVLDTPAVVAHGRIVVLGSDNRRLHEQVIAAGGRIREGRFARMNVGETEKAIEAALPHAAPDAVRRRLVELWPSLQAPLYKALDARMRDVTENLGKKLEERAAQESGAIEEILRELARSIQEELGKPEDPQMRLWPDPAEKDQALRDRDSLRARLAKIPAEIEEEKRLIRQRYAGPVPRLFPVSVTFIVPERLV